MLGRKLMEGLQIVFATLGVIAVPAGGALTYVMNLSKRQTATELQLAAHEASDKATLAGIATTLNDLKQGQTIMDQKVDQLIYRFIPAPK